MPGRPSLKQQQYYANPRNAFWPIVCALVDKQEPTFEVHHQLDYQHRCQKLTTAGFGAWDVLASCERPGSLDANIKRQSEQPNNIPKLIKNHPELQTIACNGRTAHQLFLRHIARHWNTELSFNLVLLPSSSPAMASLSLREKFTRWQELLS